MFKNLFARKPVYVHVTETRYDIFGEPSNFWNAYYTAIIKKLGIAKNVEPGWYTFDVERRGFSFYTKLLPIE